MASSIGTGHPRCSASCWMLSPGLCAGREAPPEDRQKPRLYVHADCPGPRGLPGETCRSGCCARFRDARPRVPGRVAQVGTITTSDHSALCNSFGQLRRTCLSRYATAERCCSPGRGSSCRHPRGCGKRTSTPHGAGRAASGWAISIMAQAPRLPGSGGRQTVTR
jgi:hypothetical protein